jgi:hypothetical protein
MPHLQFSLKWLMIAIAAAAVVLCLTATVRDFLSVLITTIVWCVVPTPLVASAYYGRGDIQAFAIGALTPWVVLILMLGYPLGATSFAAVTIWLLPICALCGALSVATRRWVAPRD